MDLMALLFAEGDANWYGILNTIVNVGFSVVVGWYLLTKAMPLMQAEFRTALKEQRTELSEWEKVRREADGEREKSRREDYKEQLRMVMAHCESENSRRDDIIKIQINETSQVMKDNREVMEEVRDELKKLAQKWSELIETMGKK